MAKPQLTDNDRQYHGWVMVLQPSLKDTLLSFRTEKNIYIYIGKTALPKCRVGCYVEIWQLLVGRKVNY